MMRPILYIVAISLWSPTRAFAGPGTSLVFHDKTNRHLEDQTSNSLPDDVTVCDEYFFGRQSLLPFEELPFCVNNGKCKAGWIRDHEMPCECVDSYEGPHCEFKFGQIPNECSLDCQNGSKCKLGAPSWQHFYRNTGHTKTNPLDMQHCDCPVGYTGLLCELVGVSCGSHHCHNGGTCTQTTLPDGSAKHFCDCTSATKMVAGKSIGYAGEYCEHEATSLCSESATENGNQFCVNGGVCQSETHLGCNCKVGFVGPVCEFEDNGQPLETCGLTCKNHGVCRKGAKDVSLLTKFGFDGNTSTAYNQDFEHCVCPSGYVGMQCEYQLDLCPGGVHACMNGGECVTVPQGNTVDYACDCTKAETADSRFAGDYCEMESTQFCTVGGSKSTSGVGINSFCTNGGVCRALVQLFEEHPGCDCARGFDGDNCQYSALYITSRSNMAAVMTSIIAIVGVVLAAFFIRRRAMMIRYDHVTKPSLPPTLDIIHSLGLDRDDESTEEEEEGSVPKPKGKSTYSRSTSVFADENDESEVVHHRKRFWAKNKGDANPIHVFNDVDLDEDDIRSSRKTYWPNDACNDATNPIHVFDDISVHSESNHGTAYSVESYVTDDSDSMDSEESPKIV